MEQNKRVAKSSRDYIKKIKVVLTGGHAGAAAHALIQELKTRKNFSKKIHFIGSKKALEGKDILTFEKEVFPRIGVQFHPIFTGKIQRKFTFWTIPSLIKIPFGFIHATYLLLKIKPDITVSFGGFAAYPVVVASWFLRIPVIIHEQTAVYGLANKCSSFFATKIALGREESGIFFPKEKIKVVGNPISDKIAKIKPKEQIGKPAVLLITGGSRGSAKINDLVDEILEDLLKKFVIIHQAGAYQENKFLARKKILSKRIKNNYEVYGFIKPWRWLEILKRADLIISRAGANTVSEIIATKRPAILIPLPFAYKDEQRKNALFAEKFGVAEVVDQEGLTPKRLLKEIDRLKNDREKILSKVKNKESPDRNASKLLADLVEEVYR